MNPSAAQRRWCGAGCHGHERTAVADGVKRRDADAGAIKCAVDATRKDAPDRRSDVLGTGDECVRTEPYQLTALGETILPVVAAIKQWSEAHISEIHAARDTYDLHGQG